MSSNGIAGTRWAYKNRAKHAMQAVKARQARHAKQAKRAKQAEQAKQGKQTKQAKQATQAQQAKQATQAKQALKICKNMKICSCLQPHHANAPLTFISFKMERCCLAFVLRIIACHLLPRCSPNVIKQGAKQATQATQAKQANQTWRTCENMKLCSPLQPHAAKAPLQSAPFRDNAAVCCFFGGFLVVGCFPDALQTL